MNRTTPSQREQTYQRKYMDLAKPSFPIICIQKTNTASQQIQAAKPKTKQKHLPHSWPPASLGTLTLTKPSHKGKKKQGNPKKEEHDKGSKYSPTLKSSATR